MAAASHQTRVRPNQGPSLPYQGRLPRATSLMVTGWFGALYPGSGAAQVIGQPYVLDSPGAAAAGTGEEAAPPPPSPDTGVDLPTDGRPPDYFESRWQAAGGWAVLVLAPNQLPASVDRARWLKAADELAEAGQDNAAKMARLQVE